jgi:plasmid stability protein
MIMKQLLLRVPDEVHQRLATRAADQGRSVNALATEILDTATEGATPDRRTRLRARASALGIRESVDAPAISPRRRGEILATTESWGSMAEQLINEERDRP